ncbi:MAG TPA: hypothetical protein VF234_10285 [Limnochordia bacterium]
MATIRKTGWERDGVAFTVRWAHERSWDGPEIYVEDVIEDETGRRRPDLIAAAERDAGLRNEMVDVSLEAEESARLDAAERDADMRMDERRGL